jgi:hypothetical protein
VEIVLDVDLEVRAVAVSLHALIELLPLAEIQGVALSVQGARELGDLVERRSLGEGGPAALAASQRGARMTLAVPTLHAQLGAVQLTWRMPFLIFSLLATMYIRLQLTQKAGQLLVPVMAS